MFDLLKNILDADSEDMQNKHELHEWTCVNHLAKQRSHISNQATEKRDEVRALNTREFLE